MICRNFLKAGVGGLTLALAQGEARAQSTSPPTNTLGTDQDIVVISVDGSVPNSAMIDKYKRNGAPPQWATTQTNPRINGRTLSALNPL